jgi:cytochrome c oxidase subunit 1
MWRGSISFTTPMLFAVGFLSMFLIGGINGAFSAAVPVDFALHDTYFVVAHIHYVLFGGSVMAVFAGLYYWFPKIWGRKLNESLGKMHFALMFTGMNLAFFPMHLLGLDGMPRRIATYATGNGWEPLNFISTVGAFMIAVSMLPFIYNVVAAFLRPKDQPDNPWEANTLEWATTSPPPVHNFDSLPEIHSERPLFDARHGVTAGH